MDRFGLSTRPRRIAGTRRRARNVPDGLPSPNAATASPPPRRVVAGTAVREGLQRASGGILSARGRMILEYAPLVAVFLVTEWLVLSGRASFTLLLSFAGVVAVPIFAGIFPCLLIQSSRRKGDLVPGSVSRWLGRPWLTVAVYALFLIGILLHGFLIWEQPGERVAQLVEAGVCLLPEVVLHVGDLVVSLVDVRLEPGDVGPEIDLAGSELVERRVDMDQPATGVLERVVGVGEIRAEFVDAG